MPARLVEHDTLAEVPYRHVTALLHDTSTAWLCRLAQSACVDAHTARVRLGPGHDPALRKEFTVAVGKPYTLASGLLIPTRWQATGPRALFPTMEADLRVGPADGSRTRLCLQGSYTPPLGDLGGRIDDLLLHRVVDASMQGFLAELARTLTATAHGGSAHRPDPPPSS